MAVTASFVGQSSDTARCSKFDHFVQAVTPVVSKLAEDRACPDVEVTVVFADDFVEVVDEYLSRAAEAAGSAHTPFTVERVGGLAVAKNIPSGSDGSAVTIVFGSDLHWFENPLQEAMSLFLIAHELTHPVLERLRIASGALADVAVPTRRARDYARSITRSSVDEYRCDMVANSFLQSMCTATIDGEERGLRIADLYSGGLGYVGGGLAERLAEHVHPTLPDLVDNYRNRRISVRQMWGRVVTATDQAMTMLAHAEAEAASADLPSLEDGVDGEHQAMRLYLGSTWASIRGRLEQHSLMPELQDFASAEVDILDAGEEAIYGMWRALGITVEVTGTDGEFIHVTDPVR